MLLETCIAIFFVFIQPTIHHYIGDLDDCTLSKVCNHTWVPLCGHNAADSSYRLFLDDCDLHEYNCDYNTSYREVDVKVCSQKCTKKDHPLPVTTTPMPAHSTADTSTTIVSTTHKTSTVEVSTIMSTEGVTETSKTDTSTIFVEPTTIKMTTEESQSTTTKASETTTVKTVTTTEKLEENVDENTIPQETTQKTTSVATPTTPNINCYPKHCSLPSTWETTAVGETRDFVQILRERYGDRVKFLRHTTHFPMKPDMYFRRSESFVPGRHTDRQRPVVFIK